MPGEFKQIDIHAAREMIDAGRATVVDIRNPEDYKAGHIKGALSVHRENLQEFLATADPKRNLICYCYHGFSSQSAAQFFKDKGFRQVFSVEGGFTEWQKYYPFEQSF